MSIIDKHSPETWKDTLNTLGKLLHTLATSTEDEFLSIGERLQRFHACAGDISKMASSLVSSMTEAELSMVIKDFRNLLDRMHHYTIETEAGFKNGTEILQNINEGISIVYKPIAGFRKIIKTLRILSISIKIESSQLNQDNNSFVAIAEDVEKLAALIHSKFTHIISSAESLGTFINETFARVSDLEAKQQGKTQSILDSTNETLSSLTQKNGSSSQMAYSVSAELESISKNIEEVVASMQFHDITRQQVEHVKEALENLRHKFTDETDENPEMTTIVLETGATCELQKAQLLDAEKKFTSAIVNIMDNLNGISANIINIYKNVQKIAETEDTTSSSFFSRIEFGVSSMIASLEESTRTINALSASMEEVITTVDAMSEFVSDIEEINSGIELIAVNARIKAAHTGMEGAPLGVIAEAIQMLSVDARIRKTEISDQLQKITSHASKLHMSINAGMGEGATETGSMLCNLNALVGKLHSSNETILYLLGGIQKEGYGLAVDIENTVSGIQAHHRFSAQIEKAGSLLNTIVVQSQELLPGTTIQEHAETLRHLTDRYTMQSERNIHSKYAVRDSQFMYIPKPSEEGLGDNIELF